ncbi:MAG: DUF72 domain-containing protein [Phycisphaerae bacterium]|nr:DUF72 domain-containing protein [Phycisphaerae bacterium]
MSDEHAKYVVGTSGYSFADWVGSVYPPGTKQKDMFDLYAARFQAVELNFTFYNARPGAALARMSAKAPEGFQFWVKVNQELTHKGNLAAGAEFVEQVRPMQESGKLVGLLLQFPQSFHRTAEARRYLAAALEALAALPLAVEFRHGSWDHPATAKGLAERNVAMVVPDVPALDGLYRPTPIATSPIAYLRLHSRNPGAWYGGMGARYDYSYSEHELKQLAKDWAAVEAAAQRVYAFFNNCHRAQAAQNAEAFRRILGQIR